MTREGFAKQFDVTHKEFERERKSKVFFTEREKKRIDKIKFTQSLF